MNPLFEDNHLLVLNKPPGLLTQPSGTDQDSLEQQAKTWLKHRDKKPGNVFLEAVHRLDKPVSGIVVFAKTRKALSRLHDSIRKGTHIRKTYWAWVEGSLPYDEGILEHFVKHEDFHAIIVDENDVNGKKASLTYRVLQRKEKATFIEITLLTGRYHQIRLQFSAFGYPIWGDHKYGGRQSYSSQAIALHHRRFEIPHPISQNLLIFEAPPFAPFQIGFVAQ